MVVVGEDAMSRQALARILADPLSTQIRIYDLRKLLDGRLGETLPRRPDESVKE
jgi:hypothetical protein